MTDGFKIEGLKELTQELEEMSKKAKELEGNHNVQLGILLNDNFMKKHTIFKTLDEMIDKSGFKVETTEDFEKIPDDKWDIYIKENTNFSSWDKMMEEASGEYFAKQLGF